MYVPDKSKIGEQDKILADYHQQVEANKQLSAEARAKLVEEDEDEYFE